ncbi:MAG: aminotransferase class I/II-fold pyridoxal phosphate-dependent enzyme [Ignavibacterium sp.]|nr:aminotransferase class I/II-fold pyridoxal phosphate-dependent enzyme [Ignavibacterium sp.]
MKIKITSKLPNVGTSIFTVMSKMAYEYDAINLSQGFPDFNCPDELIELVHYYQKKGFNQYAPMQGVLSLRSEISKKIEKLHGSFYNPETEITITAGATQALFTAISCIVNKGDEVIVFEPAYDSYVPVIQANGGKPVFVPLNKDDYSIDWVLTKKSITAKTKLIIINSPHNPTGSVIGLNDIRELEKLIKGKNIFIISDEVYEHITFDGYEHISLSRSDILTNRSFIISSFGKTYHTTGWKMGYCAAPELLMREFQKLHQFVVFSANTPTQYAYAEFLKIESHYLDLGNFYMQKRDYFVSKIQKSKFKIKSCKGTYFQLLDYSNFSKLNDKKFAEYLTKEVGVAVIPLSPFYRKPYNEKIIRVCFAKREEILKSAAKLLNKL